MDITKLVNQFFDDCEHDGRPANEENLRGWLWFVCPAALRPEVEAAIRADKRWQAENIRTHSLRFRVTAAEKSKLDAEATEAGLTLSQYVRKQLGF